MSEYNVKLLTFDNEEVTVVPALLWRAVDSDKIVIAPFGPSLLETISRIETTNRPDDVVRVEFDKQYYFEFTPGPPAQDALGVLKWFKEAIEKAGPYKPVV